MSMKSVKLLKTSDSECLMSVAMVRKKLSVSPPTSCSFLIRGH